MQQTAAAWINPVTSNVCSGKHENPNNLDIFGRVLFGYWGMIAKIRQFCNRFEILILTQSILKMRHSLR